MRDTWTSAHGVRMALACVGLALAGCSDGEPGRVWALRVEAGWEAAIEDDAGADAEQEAAMQDAGADAETESEPEVGTDAKSDIGADANGEADADTPDTEQPDQDSEPCACVLANYPWSVTVTIADGQTSMWYECPTGAAHDPNGGDSCSCGTLYGTGDSQHCALGSAYAGHSCTMTFRCEGLWCDATQSPCY